jgi:two-component system sensor histidine kinase/response regulator
VHAVTDGQQAVQAVQAHPPGHYALVLMDLQMPVMDGYAATQRLRNQARFDDLPILAMTAHAMAEELQRCLALGMQGRLTKPIDPALLIDTLSAYVRHDDEPAAATPPVTVPELTVVATRAATSGDPSTLFDAEDGLRRLGGAAGLLRNLVADFARDHAPAEERRALAELDDEARIRWVHSVRGVAGNLGCVRAWHAATALETELRHGPWSADSPQLQAYLRAMEATHAALMGWLGDEPSSAVSAHVPPADADLLAADGVVDELARLLAEGDMAAEALVAAHAAALQARLGPRFDGLRAAIARFDLEAALASLRADGPAAG